MKIIVLLKVFLGIGIATAGVTSAVVFSNVNNTQRPYAKVLTKENYLAIRKSQNLTSDNYRANINYATLPNSNYSLTDLLTTNHPQDQAFMLTIGSQAYAPTNLLLNGLNNTWENSGNANIEGIKDSLMLKLYDQYLMQDTSLNMQFYNYIDVVDTKEYADAAKLLNKRKTSYGETAVDREDSNYWQVLNDKGQWDPTTNNIQLVVKNSANFDYTPNTSTYYEFRPDNKYDTEYQKIYFRNDDHTRTFVDSVAWMSNYASRNLSASLTQEGSLLCVKYDADYAKWTFQSFSAANQFETIDSTYESIKTFYSANN